MEIGAGRQGCFLGGTASTSIVVRGQDGLMSPQKQLPSLLGTPQSGSPCSVPLLLFSVLCVTSSHPENSPSPRPEKLSHLPFIILLL